MIEFGFLCPVLFTILFGIIETGRMFYVRQALEYATEQAARYYMLNPAAASSSVTTALRSTMAGSMGPAVSVAYSDVANCNGNSTVICTTITASYTFTSAASFAMFGLGTPLLRASAQAVRVQQ